MSLSVFPSFKCQKYTCFGVVNLDTYADALSSETLYYKVQSRSTFLSLTFTLQAGTMMY